jgi:hypothetical protein
MRNSEFRANQDLKATPKWTERPVRKPGIRLSTVLTVGFWVILATAIGTEVLPWLSASIAGA